MSITFRQKGDFSRTYSFLERVRHVANTSILDEFGKLGVERLNDITPKRTGKTAASWYYEIHYGNGVATLTFNNSNVAGGQVIAILVQEGHGTSTGGYVPGKPYLDEALEPVYKELIEKVWKEVTSK